MRKLIDGARKLGEVVQSCRARALPLPEKRRLVADMTRHLNLLANALEAAQSPLSRDYDPRTYQRIPGVCGESQGGGESGWVEQ